MCSTSRPPAPEPARVSVVALAPGQEVERKGEFHLQLYHMPGSARGEEVVDYFARSAAPFSLRRVVVRYVKETPPVGKARHFTQSPTHGPSGEHDVVCVALVEFAPQDGLVHKLRQYTALRQHNIIARVPSWQKSYAVAFFPGDQTGVPDVGQGGRTICQYVKRPCHNALCQLAHEPDGWGLAPPGQQSRLASPPTHESARPVESAVLAVVAAAASASVERENGGKRRCNGCCVETPRDKLRGVAAGGHAVFCDACVDKGVPKVHCEACMRQTFASAMASARLCAECAREGADASGDVNGDAVLAHPPHLRVAPVGPEGSLPSKTELRKALGALLGPVQAVDVCGEAALVRLATWDEPARAAAASRNVRDGIDGCVVTPLAAGDKAPGARVRALAALVGDGLLLRDEFKVLEQWWAARRA